MILIMLPDKYCSVGEDVNKIRSVFKGRVQDEMLHVEILQC